MLTSNKNKAHKIIYKILLLSSVCVVTLYLIHHIIFGNRGVISLFYTHRVIDERQTTLKRLIEKRNALENKVNLLKSRKGDYVDEVVRYNFSVAKKNEIVLVPNCILNFKKILSD